MFILIIICSYNLLQHFVVNWINQVSNFVLKIMSKAITLKKCAVKPFNIYKCGRSHLVLIILDNNIKRCFKKIYKLLHRKKK